MPVKDEVTRQLQAALTAAFGTKPQPAIDPTAPLAGLARRLKFKTDPTLRAELKKLDAPFDAAVAQLPSLGMDRIRQRFDALQSEAIEAVKKGKVAPATPTKETVRENMISEAVAVKAACRQLARQAADLARPEIERFCREANALLDGLEADARATAEDLGMPFEPSETVRRLRAIVAKLPGRIPEPGCESSYSRPSGFLFWESGK